MSIQPVHRRAKSAFVPTLLAAIVIVALAYVIGMFVVDKAPDTVVPLAPIAIVAIAIVAIAATAKKRGETIIDTVMNLLKTARLVMKQIIAPSNLAFNGLSAYNDTGQLTKGTSWTSGVIKHRRGYHFERRRSTGTDKKTTPQTALGTPLKV